MTNTILGEVSSEKNDVFWRFQSLKEVVCLQARDYKVFLMIGMLNFVLSRILYSV